MSKRFNQFERLIAAAVAAGCACSAVAMAGDGSSFNRSMRGNASQFRSQGQSNLARSVSSGNSTKQYNKQSAATQLKPQSSTYQKLGKFNQFKNQSSAASAGQVKNIPSGNFAKYYGKAGSAKGSSSAGSTAGQFRQRFDKSGKSATTVEPNSNVAAAAKRFGKYGQGMNGLNSLNFGPGETAPPIPDPGPTTQTPPSGPGVLTDAGALSRPSKNIEAFKPSRVQADKKPRIDIGGLTTKPSKDPVIVPNTVPGGNTGVEPGQQNPNNPGGGGQGGGMGNGQGGGKHHHGCFPWQNFVPTPWNYGYGYGYRTQYVEPVYVPAGQVIVNEAPVVIEQPAPAPVLYEQPAPAPATYGQPVATPVASPVVGTTSGNADLVLEDIIFVEPATRLVGPAYRVKFRNNGSEPVGKFRVALLAGMNGTADEQSPRAEAEIESLANGQIGEVTLRLPRTAMRIVTVSNGAPTAFTHLMVAVDAENNVQELDESNNAAIVDRAELEAAR